MLGDLLWLMSPLPLHFCRCVLVSLFYFEMHSSACIPSFFMLVSIVGHCPGQLLAMAYIWLWYRDLLFVILQYVQLDWPSEMDTLKINLPRDQDNYGGSETTYEKISARRIQICGESSSIFVFLGPHRFSFASSKALTRRSQVLLKCLSLTANWFFRKSSWCVLARKMISLVKIRVDRDRSKY